MKTVIVNNSFLRYSITVYNIPSLTDRIYISSKRYVKMKTSGIALWKGQSVCSTIYYARAVRTLLAQWNLGTVVAI